MFSAKTNSAKVGLSKRLKEEIPVEGKRIKGLLAGLVNYVRVIKNQAGDRTRLLLSMRLYSDHSSLRSLHTLE